MTYEEFNEKVNQGVEEALGHDAKEIAKTKAESWYQTDIREAYDFAVRHRKDRGAAMTDEAYWKATISTTVDNLIF